MLDDFVEPPEPEFSLKLDGGKYTLIRDRNRQYALRYGEPWRDLTGDNLIYSLIVEIERLNNQIKLLKGY